MNAEQGRTPLEDISVTRAFASPFRWLRILATADATCSGCGSSVTMEVPVFVNWFDRTGAEAQRSAADGIVCRTCGVVLAQPLPLLQYRTGDVVGLVIAFPLNTPAESDRRLIQDVIAAAGVEETEGASVVVAVRMHWWRSVWKRPLGPVLIGDVPLVLAESDEEVQRWRRDTVNALTLPDARAAVEAFVTRDSYGEARALLADNEYLLSERWRVTVDALGDAIKRLQHDPAAANLVEQRLGRLRQIRLVGLHNAEEEMLTGPIAHLADRATTTRDPRLRAQHLGELLAALDTSTPTIISAATLTTLVAALHAHPDRGTVTHQELMTTAQRALEHAQTVFGDDHSITSAAIINLAIITEERTDIPHADALADATRLLHHLAPRAARRGGREVAEIATNLAAIQRAATADDTEAVSALLDDASHVRSLIDPDGDRAQIVELVDQAAALRSRRTGPRRANARDAIVAIEHARQLESELNVLSPAESVLIENNLANALNQLHELDPSDTTRQALLAAARTACQSANSRLDRLHPVAIDTLANAGAILSDLYSESLRSDTPDQSLWFESVTHLEDALTRAQAVYFEYHEVTLRIMVNIAAAYGRPLHQQLADEERCEALFREVLEHAPPDQLRFTVVAALNLGQLHMGQGRWVDAADAYGVASDAHAREIARARTRLTKLAEITGARDLAARRALALSNAGRWEDAITVLEDARGRLVPPGPDPSDSFETSERATVATAHIACSDYGTLGVVRVPDGTLFGYHSPLATRDVDPLIEQLLDAPDRPSRQAALDTLGEHLAASVIDPLTTILSHSIVPVDELHIVACGALAACPLHAINDLAGHNLISNYVVRYRRTTRTPTPNLSQARDNVVAVIASPASLPFARAERDALARWASSLTEPSDGRSRTHWLSSVLADATAVHLACHAHSDRDDPMASAFDLEDGQVSVRDLAEVITPQLALVVAPACQSATPSPYAPDELLGVAHALVHSGARAVIASMWDADDEVTAFVISAFYQEMAAGREPVDALTHAQRYVATVTGPELHDLARRRLDDDEDARWLSHDLAVELSARSADPAFRSSDTPVFAHPADWATLSYLDA